MKKILYWLIPLTWMGFIFYSSAQPYQNQDVKPLLNSYLDLSFLIPIVENIVFVYHQSEVSVDTLGINGFVEFFLRKGAHVTVFFVLCMLLYGVLRKTTLLEQSYCLVFSLLITVVYAGLDEWHQGFTPNRTPYFGDVILDSIGASIFVIGYLAWSSWKRKQY